jgi:hypothetical protein
MPMLYWPANRGGLHTEVHRRATQVSVTGLRRDLPAVLADEPDEAIADLWAGVDPGRPRTRPPITWPTARSFGK